MAKLRCEIGRGPGGASAAAGLAAGNLANDGRLFINCINLISPGRKAAGAVPRRP
jgi:hypothetical protein